MKRFILSSVLVPILFLSTAEARAECVSLVVGANNIVSMTYDTAAGVNLQMVRNPDVFTARVPKLINGQPNPDFDRIYGLLLKTFPTRAISYLCLSGTVKDGATLDITSVTVTAERPGVQKVAVCDTSGIDCASVSYDRALNTSK